MKNEIEPGGIVCAIDVNDYDQSVVDLAGTFAQQTGRCLDILHVTLFPDPANAAWPAYLGSPSAIIEDNLRLRKIDTTVANVSSRRHHLTGIPTTRILEFIERNEPSLLVLGTHGRTGLKRLYGSVASKVLRHAKCPVMVLRQRQNSQDLAERKQKVT